MPIHCKPLPDSLFRSDIPDTWILHYQYHPALHKPFQDKLQHLYIHLHKNSKVLLLPCHILPDNNKFCLYCKRLLCLFRQFQVPVPDKMRHLLSSHNLHKLCKPADNHHSLLIFLSLLKNLLLHHHTGQDAVLHFLLRNELPCFLLNPSVPLHVLNYSHSLPAYILPRKDRIKYLSLPLSLIFLLFLMQMKTLSRPLRNFQVEDRQFLLLLTLLRYALFLPLPVQSFQLHFHILYFPNPVHLAHNYCSDYLHSQSADKEGIRQLSNFFYIFCSLTVPHFY